MFWFGSPLHLDSLAILGSDYGECWKNACPRVHDMDANDEFLQEFVFGVWRIWKVRNDMVFRGTMWNPTKALELWRGQVSEFRDVMVKIDNQGPWHPGSIMSARGVQGGWKKPKFGTLKLRWCLELKDKVGWFWVAVKRLCCH
ncbi:hypothetical protein ACFX2K_024000 [Malus domestica]